MGYEITNLVLVAALALVLAKNYRSNKLSYQRLAAIEAAGDGIGILDADFNLIYMNRALLELHEIGNQGAYIGRHWENLYTDKGKEKIKTEVMPALLKKGFWRGESLIVTQNKRLVPTEMFLTALPHGGYIGTARDISQRKQDEAEKEILQKKFAQAQKMELMGSLTGGVAHDFNNILTIISTNLELIGEETKPDTIASKALDSAQRAVKRGSELTHRLLAFARRQVLVPENVQVNAIIPETMQMLQRTLGENVRLAFEPDPYLWEAQLDVGQTENAIINLCINSRDAMPAGGEITIRTTNIPANTKEVKQTAFIENQNYIKIEIADNGAGMPPEMLNKIFEPFYTTKDAGKGSGLGLSMVYGFTKQSNGYILVDSTKDVGTTVSLYFPAVTA